MKPYAQAPFPRVVVLEGRGSKTFVGYMEPKKGMESVHGETILSVGEGVIVTGRPERNYTGKITGPPPDRTIHEVQEIAITLTTARRFGFVDDMRMEYPTANVWVASNAYDHVQYKVTNVQAKDTKACGWWVVATSRSTAQRIDVEIGQIGVFPYRELFRATEIEALKDAIAANIIVVAMLQNTLGQQQECLKELEGHGNESAV